LVTNAGLANNTLTVIHALFFTFEIRSRMRSADSQNQQFLCVTGGWFLNQTWVLTPKVTMLLVR
jgi:hypothetical protein